MASPLQVREDVEGISIIKDLSERDKQNDEALVEELIGNKRREETVTPNHGNHPVGTGKV